MASTNVFIIHGTKATSQSNWFPWLKDELKKIGANVIVPAFPTPENQSLASWTAAFEKYLPELDENSIVIGHSLGPVFLLSVIAKLDHPIKAAFFVAPFLQSIGISEYDALNRTFVTAKFDWEKIKKNCRKFYVLFSDNDPYVPRPASGAVARRLNVNPVIIPGGQHLNAEAGYNKFDLLLKKIKAEL